MGELRYRSEGWFKISDHPGEEVVMAVTKACVMCGSGVDVAPLLMLEFRTGIFWVCAQHLPVLIHDPARLCGKLEGAEGLTPSDYHD